MNDRPDDLRDERLAIRLAAATGEPPADLTTRLEALARVDATSSGVRHGPPLWVELGPQLAGLLLLLALFTGFVPSLAQSLAHPAPTASHAAMLVAASFLVPLALLLAVFFPPRRSSSSRRRADHGR